MDLMKLGKDLLGQKLGSGSASVMDGLAKLTGGASNELDLKELAGKLSAGGLGDKVKSWLGDGANDEVSADELKSALGEDKINEVAQGMGVDNETAANKLSEVLPTLMDKTSSNGAVAEKFSGATAALDVAKGLFK